MKNQKPIVKVCVKNLADTINSIYMFFEDDKIINMLHAQKVAKDFGLDINHLKTIPLKDRYEYVAKKIEPLYNQKLKELKNVVQIYQEFWNANQNKIHTIFKDVFDLEYTTERICNCFVSINSVCPRYYETWSFDNSYLKSKELFMDNTIHELIHFFWFDCYKNIFPNWKESDFCAPSLCWGISELVVDAIAKCTELKNYTREKTAYGYLYEIEHNGQNLIEHVRNMFSASKNIKEFMLHIYDLLNNNQTLTQQIIK